MEVEAGGMFAACSVNTRRTGDTPARPSPPGNDACQDCPGRTLALHMAALGCKPVSEEEVRLIYGGGRD